MRKRAFLVTAVAVAAMLVAGGLFASNMGFKLNYLLSGPGAGSLSGNSSIALPYNQQTNLNNAFDVIQDVNAAAGAPVVGSISRFLPASDSFETYTGATGAAFALTPGEGYQINVTADVNYIIVGSHDPGLVIALDGPGTGGSLSGNNEYAYPYHSTSANAFDLIQEINAAAGAPVVGSVSRFLKASDSFETYTGATGVAFPLTPGQSYQINVTADVSFVPSHF